MSIQQHSPQIVATVAGRVGAHHSDIPPQKMHALADDIIREAVVVGADKSTPLPGARGDAADASTPARSGQSKHDAMLDRGRAQRDAAGADMAQQWKKGQR